MSTAIESFVRSAVCRRIEGSFMVVALGYQPSGPVEGCLPSSIAEAQTALIQERHPRPWCAALKSLVRQLADLWTLPEGRGITQKGRYRHWRSV